MIFKVLADSADSGRSSLLAATGFYTQRRQILASFSSDMEINGGVHRIAASLSGRKFPDSFHGIGPESPGEEEIFTPRILEIQAAYQRRLLGGLRPGIRFEHRSLHMAEIEDGGSFAAGAVPGGEGGVSAAAGAILEYDTRNSTIYPLRGRLWRLEAMGFGRAWGSDFSFGRRLVDLREYIPAGKGRVLAVRAFAVENVGRVPFDRMAVAGGESLLRGYTEGRYRDRSAAVFVAEMRAPVWRRFGCVLFGGAGDVAARLGDLAPRRFKHSFGAGVRFALGERDRLNIRADFGFGAGSSGFYLGGTEVF